MLIITVSLTVTYSRTSVMLLFHILLVNCIFITYGLSGCDFLCFCSWSVISSALVTLCVRLILVRRSLSVGGIMGCVMETKTKIHKSYKWFGMLKNIEHKRILKIESHIHSFHKKTNEYVVWSLSTNRTKNSNYKSGCVVIYKFQSH
jgi:hypothetical protein